MTEEKKPTMPDATAKPASDKPKPAAPPKPSIEEQERTPAHKDWMKDLLKKLGDRAVESWVASGEFTVVIENGDGFLQAMQAVRDAGYDYLSDISSVDYSEWEDAPKRFGLSYHFYSMDANHRLRVKVFLDDGEAAPSVMGIWQTADFHEREAWDLMGIPFSGREGLTRILLPDDWEGHPLRKELAKNAGNEAYTQRMVRKFSEDA